jgi:hypothetical protein
VLKETGDVGVILSRLTSVTSNFSSSKVKGKLYRRGAAEYGRGDTKARGDLLANAGNPATVARIPDVSVFGDILKRVGNGHNSNIEWVKEVWRALDAEGWLIEQPPAGLDDLIRGMQQAAEPMAVREAEGPTDAGEAEASRSVGETQGPEEQTPKSSHFCGWSVLCIPFCSLHPQAPHPPNPLSDSA